MTRVVAAARHSLKAMGLTSAKPPETAFKERQKLNAAN